MSKEAAVRAMREARYAERMARPAAGSPAAPTRPAKPTVRTPEASMPPPVAPPTGAGDALCGHRSMNGRSCTRELGHAAKNHRYS